MASIVILETIFWEKAMIQIQQTNILTNKKTLQQTNTHINDKTMRLTERKKIKVWFSTQCDTSDWQNVTTFKLHLIFNTWAFPSHNRTLKSLTDQIYERYHNLLFLFEKLKKTFRRSYGYMLLFLSSKNVLKGTVVNPTYHL